MKDKALFLQKFSFDVQLKVELNMKKVLRTLGTIGLILKVKAWSHLLRDIALLETCTDNNRVATCVHISSCCIAEWNHKTIFKETSLQL